MTNIALIVTGVIVGLALNVGVPYYFVSSTKKQTKSPAVAALLSLVLGPFIGFSYARPHAWALGFVATLLFYVPLVIGASTLIARGSVVVGGVLAGYVGLATLVTAVLLTNDQNEQFGDSVSSV